MGEIRSPYFSIDQDYLKDNAEIRSPYFSRGGDYLGYNAEIRSPYFSFGTRDYHGENAEIHSPYSSAAGYLGEDAEIPSETAEIPSETFFQQNNIVENPYNAESFVEQDVVLNVYNTEKVIQHSGVPHLSMDFEDETDSFLKKVNDEKCIFRVPHKLHQSHEAYYAPRVVSIGPFHHDKTLLINRTDKKIYLRAFCSRAGETREERNNFLNGKLLNTIEENEDKIYRYYDDDDSVVAGSEFSKMVLYDAVFILEYLLRNNDREKYEEYDHILQERGEIRGDLMILENQLPFFILEKLYNHLLEVKRNYISFPELAYEYFSRYNRKSAYNPKENKDILHFIDLIRSSLCFNPPSSKSQETKIFYHSATKLDEARIKFIESPGECLINVKFYHTKNELHIPRLEINSYTSTLFRNLMAFELRHYREKKYICCYIKLFNNLVDNSEDAKRLIEDNIILADRDGDAVKQLIGSLAEEIPGGGDTIYYKLHEDLETYREINYMKNKKFLIQEYFANEWKSMATVAAIILLLLTVVQTFCAVVSLP